MLLAHHYLNLLNFYPLHPTFPIFIQTERLCNKTLSFTDSLSTVAVSALAQNGRLL